MIDVHLTIVNLTLEIPALENTVHMMKLNVHYLFLKECFCGSIELGTDHVYNHQ